jgi:hypothetical protein
LDHSIYSKNFRFFHRLQGLLFSPSHSSGRPFKSGSKNFNFLAIPEDRHDIGGFVKKKKKHPDLIDEELQRRARLRADLELAFYGPVPEPLAPPKIDIQLSAQPLDVKALADIMAAQSHKQMLAQIAAAGDEDEADLEAILRDIV